MESLQTVVAIGFLIFASGAGGLALQGQVSERHSADRARDMLGGVVGMLVLLLALVLGLLVWTAYGVYATQQTGVQTIATRALEFDVEMRQYGKDGEAARDLLRQDLAWAHEQFWGEDSAQAEVYDASFTLMGKMTTLLDSLPAQTPDKQRLLGAARANFGFIGEQRVLMSMQAGTPVAWPMVYAVTFWSCLLFAGMGFLSKLCPTSVVALGFGTISVALALFLVLEYGKPYTGSIRVSPGPIEQAILALGAPTS